jgi:hypothetical protein
MKIFNKNGKNNSNAMKVVILFNTVKDGLLAEKVILKNNYFAKKIAPPPDYRKGCEISIEIRIDEQNDIEHLLLKKGIQHQGIIKI